MEHNDSVCDNKTDEVDDHVDKDGEIMVLLVILRMRSPGVGIIMMTVVATMMIVMLAVEVAMAIVSKTMPLMVGCGRPSIHLTLCKVPAKRA